MKIGLIARAEYARGLAIQSKGFYDHMPVDRVLLVKMARPDCETDDSWYPGATVTTFDEVTNSLNQGAVMSFLDGLDIVFTIETAYDWRLPDWARSVGVKTVVQGNPEFCRHGLAGFGHLPSPDAWWWPTSWRLGRLPAGPVVPVPMPDIGWEASDGPVRFVHVVGKRAYGDRNGTDVVISCLRALDKDVDITISGWGWELPEFEIPRGLNVAVERTGYRDRWTMYEDQSMLVLPRRYGGLSLPALEAAACGVAVMMPDVSPNEELAQYRFPTRHDRFLRLAAGKIAMADTDHIQLAEHINHLSHSNSVVNALQKQAYATVPRWSTMAEVYMRELERVLEG